MKLSTITSLLAIGLFMDGSLGFQSQSLSPQQRSTSLNGYVPSGFTPEQYEKFKAAEAKKKQKKNLGRMGPKGFQSRSFQSFQEALERGEATHLMPVMNAEKRVKSGELKPEDIPVSQSSSKKQDFANCWYSILTFILTPCVFIAVHAKRRKMGQCRYQGS